MADTSLANPDPDAPSLAGGEYGQQAFQSVEGPSGKRTVGQVPRATMVQPAPLPSDFGVFHDLVPQERPQVGGVDFGVFSDLIPKPPPSITPASDAVVAQTPSLVGRVMEAAKAPSPEWLQPFEQFLTKQRFTPQQIEQAIRLTPYGQAFTQAEAVLPTNLPTQIAGGALKGVSEAVAGQSSIAGAGLLAAIPEGTIGRAVAAGFTVEGLRQIPELYRQYQATDDPAEKARIFATGAIMLLPALGLKGHGGAVERGAEPPPLPTEAVPPEVPPTAPTAVEPVAPPPETPAAAEQPPTVAEPAPIIPDRFRVVGSRGRGEAGPTSDYDLATKLTPEEEAAWHATPEGEYPVLPQEVKDAANAGHDVFIENDKGQAWKVEPHPVDEGQVVVERVSQIEKNLLAGGAKPAPAAPAGEAKAAEGHVTLYQGRPAGAAGREGTTFWTTDLETAQAYAKREGAGGTVNVIHSSDLPPESFADPRDPTGDTLLTPEQYSKEVSKDIGAGVQPKQIREVLSADTGEPIKAPPRVSEPPLGGGVEPATETGVELPTKATDVTEDQFAALADEFQSVRREANKIRSWPAYKMRLEDQIGAEGVQAKLDRFSQLRDYFEKAGNFKTDKYRRQAEGGYLDAQQKTERTVDAKWARQFHRKQTQPRVSEPPLGGETKYMHPSERPEVPKITEVPPERVPPEPESNDWTTATEPIEKQAGNLRLKADKEGGFVDLSGVADLGRRIYERGVDFARWSAEMIRHLGEKIKPHLQAVWDSLTGKNMLPGTGESGGIGKTGRRKAAFGAKLLPGYSELDALTGKRSAKLQKSTADVERITKEFKRTAKTPKVENAMSAWAEAQGDLGVLKQQEGLAKGKMFRQAAKDAQKLTPEQQALALKGRQTFDIMGKRVQHYGMLNNFRQNYVPHLFDVGMKLTGFGSAKLQSKFKFAKAAKYQSFFEADQAGLKPKTMEMGKLLGLYTEHANQLIADRQFVQGAQVARSEAGEPLAIPRGRAGPVQSDSGGQAVLVNPHSFKSATDRAGNPVDQLKYRVDPDQPALRKWLFAGKDTQGKPIFMEDDLAIHPELAKRLKAMSGRSRIRQWYDEPSSGGFGAIPKAIVKNLDTAQAVMKREMFGLLAPFHQVQEGTHAIGHTVNPLFNIPKMGKLTPAMIDAAEHGLILKSERGSQAAAMEGVGGKGQFASQIARKFGGAAGRKVADVMDGYQDFLFEHYIPGLKFKTYEHMLPRNMKLYAKELASGEVTAGDIKMLTAQQANAAYGKLNLALLDRSPTLQHILQALLIAPDFLEARGKFVGQAAKTFLGSKAGQEQLRAIAVLSMANAGMAYVITKAIGGEYDPKRPFEVQNADGTRSYFMRSVPEDFARLVLQGTDKRREFVSARINPLVNTAYQVGVSGRNYRGEKISTADSLWELVNNYVPIIARSMPVLRNLTQTSRDSPISPLERLVGSLGIKVNRTSPITKTYQLAHDWKIAQGIPPDTGTYPVSKYQQMRYALEDNNQEKAADEFQKLLNAAGGDRKKVLAGFHESLNHPFTESAAMDIKFRNSLDGPSRAIYDAAKDRRHEIMRRFNEMKALEVRAVSR